MGWLRTHRRNCRRRPRRSPPLQRGAARLGERRQAGWTTEYNQDMTCGSVERERKVACIPGLPACKATAAGSVQNDYRLLFRDVHVDAVRLSLELKALGMRREYEVADLPA